MSPIRIATVSLSLIAVLGAASVVEARDLPTDVKPSRSELFDATHGDDPAIPPTPPADPPVDVPGTPVPPVPGQPVTEIKHNVEITGTITPSIRLDLELHYNSTNRFKWVVIGGQGWVKEPEHREMRPGVEYLPDGKYKIKFQTFLKSWLGARWALDTVRIGVLKRGAAPAVFELRAKGPAGMIPMEQAKGINVIALAGAGGGVNLSLNIDTHSGPAPHGLLGLPRGDGESWLDLPVLLEP